MLVGLDWCRTCALGSRIWKNMKKIRRSRFDSLDLFYLKPSCSMWTSIRAQTLEVRKRVQAPNDHNWSSALSTTTPPTFFFPPFSFFFLFSFFFFFFFLLFYCSHCHPKTPWRKKHTKEIWRRSSPSFLFFPMLLQ